MTLSNIVKIGSRVAIIDLESATLSQKGDVPSILSNKIAGVSQKFSSAILPPELIARFEISDTSKELQKYESYWASVRSDAYDMDKLNTQSINAISGVINSLQEQIESFVSNTIDGVTSIRSSLNPRLENPEDSWRQKISGALKGISINDLPISLSRCRTLEDFSSVWMRLKQNIILWSRIRPRINGKYAYVAKYHDDRQNSHDSNYELPYNAVSSSEKIDVWGFGMFLFSLCTRSFLFQQTLDGDLQGAQTYEQLYNWNSTNAKHVIRSSVQSPIIQDLLLKILTRETNRLPSMNIVLQHPFFGSWSSSAAKKIIDDYEEEIKFMEPLDKGALIQDDSSLSSPSDETISSSSHQPQDRSIPSKPPIHFNYFSVEKICKIVFTRLNDIKVPTSFIVLPYKLVWNDVRRIYEAPSDSITIAKAEKIGKHLLNINTLTAKLHFWLRVKENLAQTNGKEFKSKIINWIQRARAEGSGIIAREIVTAIKCDDSYEPICIEMLDEEMTISHARAFIRDPMKAAAVLIHEEVLALLDCYEDQFMYLIDEHRGYPTMETDSLSISFQTDGTYPIVMDQEENELRDFLLPFIDITVMVATANDGLHGLSRLLGLNIPIIPESWNGCSLGLVHKKESSGKSSVIEFATIRGILRKEFKVLYSDIRLSKSSQEPITKGHVDKETELRSLEAFYQRQDSLGSFSGLQRVYDKEDDSLTFWTCDENQITRRNQREFSDGQKRLDQLEAEIAEKNKIEEEVIRLSQKLQDMKAKTEARMLRRREKKVRVVSPKLSPKNSIPFNLPDISVPPILEQSSTSTSVSSEKIVNFSDKHLHKS